MSKPLVTIAIPTYNRAGSYLRKALESALRQTYEPTEVLVVDNASTDGTPALVRSYEEEYPQLRYIRRAENHGPIQNFQHCLDQAEGAFFLMLHDDDCIDSDFVATCMETANYDTGIGYVRTGIRCIDAAGEVVNTYPNEAGGLQHEAYVDAWLQGGVYWYFSSSLLNTEVFREVGGFTTEFELVVDLVSFARIAVRTEGVNIRPVKASYRKHDERITDQSDLWPLIDEYRLLRDTLKEEVAADWEPQIETHANAFCGRLLCRYADEVVSTQKRFAAYLRIARVFGIRHVPRPLSKIVRGIAPDRVERYLERKVRSWRRASRSM